MSEITMEQVAASTTVIVSSILNEDVEHLPKSLDRNLENLEPHQLVCLSSQHGHNSIPIETLREIIDYTKLFEDPQACAEYIESSNEINTFVMISKEISEEFLLRIHNLSQISGIYVHNTSEENNKEYLSKYSNVKQVSADVNLLLAKLDNDVKTFLKQDNNVLITNHSFNSLPEEEVSHGDALSWWSVFLDLLLYHLPYSKDDCLRKLLDTLTTYYTGNSAELRTLKQFENDYKMEDAINWYTRETFVYRLLNKAFRQRNITLLLLFGFFIQDMYRQLNDEHQKFKNEHSSSDLITVYRGQLMWNEEIQDIKNGYNKIVNWCFFSTTHARQLACIYMNDLVQTKDPIQNVLFEINIDPRKMSYPYADISDLSHFPNESEILFMIGTAFDIIEIVYNETERLWLIKLELEEDQRKTKENSSLPTTNSTISKRSLLKIAVRTLLQRFDSIPIGDMDIVFNQIFELFPTETNWLTAIRFHCLANHEEHRYDNFASRFQSRTVNYYKALNIWREYVNDIELNCHLDIADIYFEIAECYTHHSIKNDELAKVYYDLALENYTLAQKSVSLGRNETTRVYEKLDDIYRMQMKIDKMDNSSVTFAMALKNIEDYIEYLVKSSQSNNVIFASLLKKLAEMYKSVEKYDEALMNYEKALDMYRSQTSFDHYTISCLAEEIADIYTRYKNDHSSALKYQEIVRDIKPQEKWKFGHFMTAAALHKERTMLQM